MLDYVRLCAAVSLHHNQYPHPMPPAETRRCVLTAFEVLHVEVVVVVVVVEMFTLDSTCYIH